MQTDKKIISYRKLASKLSHIRRGKKVVVATGIFDLFHTGHLMFLDFAKRQGNILVVGVGSDRTVKLYKGDARPVIPEALRMRLIAGLSIVDFVVLLDEDPIDQIGGREFFQIVRPDIWVVPFRDHNPKGVQKFARELKTHLVRNPRITPGRVSFPLSTTYLIDKIRKMK